ncbi:MAG: hypothetical protein WAU91_02215 [Desulfatitalea sp.]
MVNALTSNCRFFAQLLSACLGLLLWIHPCQANNLKDIRVGEHDTFTRIVFELDRASQAEPFVSDNSDQLRVVFRDMTSDLVRKIPIERSRHVQEIQLWLEKNQLSVVFKLNAPYVHTKSSSMSDPPRVVVDIHWQAATGEQSASTAASRPSDTTATPPKTAPSLQEPTPAPFGQLAPLQPDPSRVSEAPAEAAKSAALPAEPPSLADTQPAEISVWTPPAPSLQQSIPTPAGEAVIPLSAESAQRTNWLQYYLVIGLVILTIVILLMLVVMLLTRYRWANDKLLINPNEQLQRQVDQIATIDVRIKEELKRYKKA